MPVATTRQLDFIAYIQRMLVEGDFVATYKYALLHALADICIEKPFSVDPNSELQVSFAEIAEKFIALYWQHALPFTGADNETMQGELLKQNSGKQAKIITELYACHNNNIRNINQLKSSDRWPSLFKDTLKTLKEGPLWRLQILSKKEQCFLYPHVKTQKHITLNSGIAYCFRRFYDLVVHLSRHAWLQKIQSISANQHLLGAQTQLDEFLFGVNRQTITKARPVLEEIQQGKCFYCQKPLNSKTELDHFIPFAKYANDLGHNFVAAHSSCNNSKRDHLSAIIHRDRWYEQNIIQNSKLIDTELSPYFNCDAPRSEAVTSWAYQTAVNNNAQLWLGKGCFESVEALQNEMLVG
ncbi:HNH endonuclease [Psychromonas ossibalaenae]|uniref:HNH endonuclease n=1 Tax=Psychromonas ossibalaenae TaxID=444922 RepID=UPI00036DCCF2|nr:HNH endonuclease [Psychromonas ossibalaenae]